MVKEKASNVNELKREMICHLSNEKSLVLKYDLNGIYAIDSIEKDNTLFVRDTNGPLGIRYMITKEVAFKNLDSKYRK